ncbi:FG-GAP-like repeat-containing protein [Flavobacterium sp. '19STA2R22 D10 B1']|uniref:FG-GAP-like repeat-containing protein n=1 Tax=Flavobacterium aerium TaxID=3037261 RepID=UPI00278C82F8|nr:FG-GAP-like repeat-containing protein [Flavobacterium sp. '19STA2R22 D10 B1']
MKLKLPFIYASLLSVFASNAQAVFEESTATTLQGVFYGDCAWIDVNNDTFPELLLTGAKPGYSGTTKFYKNTNGVLSEDITHHISQLMYSSVAIADINSDGYDDIVISGTKTENGTNIDVFEIHYNNNGDGTFYIADNVSNISPVTYGSIQAKDLNNDGFVDLLINGRSGSGNTNITKLYSQDNTGHFTEQQLSLAGTYFSATKIFDANGDGLFDLLITGFNNAYQPQTVLYINQGNFLFEEKTTSLKNLYFSSIDVADINGDNHPDLLLSGLHPTELASVNVYTNDGSANFTLADTNILPSSTGASRWIDYNKDGLMDIFVIGNNNNGNHAKFYKNNGNLDFTEDLENSAVVMGLNMSKAEFKDVDHDGDLDLIIMGFEGSTAYSKIYINKTPALDCLPVFEYNADGNMIMNVTLGTINNTSPSQSGTTPIYEDFTSISTDLTAGQTYPIAVKGASSTFESDVMVYIDWNKNGNLSDPGESFYLGRLAAANPFNAHTITGNIIVPEGTTAGSTKMRIVKNTNVASYSNPQAPNSINSPCDTTLRAGQTEDYTINILASTPPCAGEPGPNVGDTGCISFTYNGTTVQYATVRAADGNVWLQQNLGSSKTATMSNDELAYGDLFQWGRWDDKHQVRNSTAQVNGLFPNNPSGLNGGNNHFLTPTPAWWNQGVLSDTWQAATAAAVSATDGCDPCKALGNEWKLPTPEEWQAVVTGENITNIQSAFDSHLKLTIAGNRGGTGELNFVGVRGFYWSNTPSSTGAKLLYYSNAIVNPTAGYPRGQGASIRCLKSFAPVVITAVTITTQGNVDPKITTDDGTLQLLAAVTPATSNQAVVWSIVSGSQSATISENGLVTAINNGIVKIKATSVGNTAVSATIEVTISGQTGTGFPYPYCNDVAVTTPHVYPIYSVNFAGIQNTSDFTINGNPLMEDFTTITAQVQQGGTYPVNIKGVTDGQQISSYMYIDWNKDFVFDEGEAYDLGILQGIGNIATYTVAGELTTNIVIPATAPIGTTRMRIVHTYYNPSSTMGNFTNRPCPSEWFLGQTEDYSINVSAGSLGIDEFEQNNFVIYPNPTDNILNIKSTQEIKTVEIYNQIGQLVSKGTSNQIDISSAARGVYMVHVQFENGQTIIRKVIKK